MRLHLTPLRALLLICLGALALRLALLPFIAHPGIGDPNYYYLLGERLLNGHGFTIEFIWQYNDPPAALTHPIDHWLPLTGALAAGGMALFGQTVTAALIPFILIGALLPALTYAAARDFGVGVGGALFAAGAAAVLPEFVLNSLRTDTTLPNAVFVCASILFFIRALRGGRARDYALSGALAGLAYLTRNDATLLLPMWAVTLIVWRLSGARVRWRAAILAPVALLLVITPWLARNQAVLGYLTPRETSVMFFFTDQRDHYAYQRTFSLETMLAQQTPAQILSKRLFEMAAALKQIYTALDVFLPVAVAGGLLLTLAARDRDRLRWLSPTLILLLGAFVAYTILVPYKGQSGSFKKAYLTIVPLLLPLAGWALERAIGAVRLRAGAMLLALAFTGANAVELVRADATFTNNYLRYIAATVETANALPDTNGDGEIVLMAQDPFMLGFFGMRAMMIPMEDRETILEVAARYGADYLMMPPDRPSLDPLYTRAEADPRFIFAAAVPGYNVELFGFAPDAR